MNSVNIVCVHKALDAKDPSSLKQLRLLIVEYHRLSIIDYFEKLLYITKLD